MLYALYNDMVICW